MRGSGSGKTEYGVSGWTARDGPALPEGGACERPARPGVALLRCDGALANVRDIEIASRANLLRGQRFYRQGVAVEDHKFDFECFPVTMHMNDHAYIACFKTCRRFDPVGAIC